MGTSSSIDEFAKKLDRVARAVVDTRGPLEAAGMAGKQVFLAVGSSAIGARPTGTRKPVGARYDLGRKGRDGFVVVTYTGPAHLINNPTRPHFIAARRQASRARASQLAAGVGAVTAFGGTAKGMFGRLGAQSLTRSGNRRGGARSLTIGGEHAAYAFHPGTRGKGFAQAAKAIVARQSPDIYMRAGITRPLREVFT